MTNRVSRVLGMSETARWLNLSLYQGAPAKKGLTTLAMAASTNPLLQDKGARDPTLYCTAYKKQRFYIFSRSEPEDTKDGDRDIFNEKPTREEQSMALAAQPVKGDVALGSKGVIHTTKGDIVSRRSKLAIRRSFPRSTSSCIQTLCQRRSKTLLPMPRMGITMASSSTVSFRNS